MNDNPNQCTFTHALREKYCDSDDTSVQESFIIGIAIHGRPRNASDNGKEAELGFLRNVVLTNSSISTAGIPMSGLADLCPNVTDLDLSRNVLHCWSEVLAIIRELPLLTYLNLGSNRIKEGDTHLDAHRTQQKSLMVEHLSLSETKVSWLELSKLARIMPRLRELHVCNNGYTGVDDIDLKAFRNLKCLMLNDNNITSWKEIWKMNQLPALSRLVLSGNPLKGIFYSTLDMSHTTDISGMSDGDSSPSTNLQVSDKAMIWDMCSQVLSYLLHRIPLESHDDIDSAGCRLTQEKSCCDSMCEAMDQMEVSDQTLASKTVMPSETGSGDGPRVGHINANCHDEMDESLKKIPHNEPASPEEVEIVDIEGISLDEHKVVEQEATVSAEVTAEKIVPFSSLDTLVLSQTWIENWDEITALAQFPSLKKLRISDVLLLKELPKEERRKLFIASLPNVTTLNGSEVSLDEREKSERQLLRHFHDKNHKPHVYQTLEKKHGKLKPIETVDIGFGYQEWPEVKFVYQGAAIHTGPVHAVEPIGKLKTFVAEQLLHVPRRSVRLYHLACSAFHDTGEACEFNDLILDSMPLSRYNIFDGDEIHIDINAMPRKTNYKIGNSLSTSKR